MTQFWRHKAAAAGSVVAKLNLGNPSLLTMTIKPDSYGVYCVSFATKESWEQEARKFLLRLPSMSLTLLLGVLLEEMWSLQADHGANVSLESGKDDL